MKWNERRNRSFSAGSFGDCFLVGFVQDYLQYPREWPDHARWHGEVGGKKLNTTVAPGDEQHQFLGRLQLLKAKDEVIRDTEES